MGVIGAITPWNSPIASDAQKVAPALAAGNAVVLKPAQWTPLVSLRLAQIIESTGLPRGLLSVLPGFGREVGDAIVRHPSISKVSFTGGTDAGRHVAEVAARKLMPVSLELGGKSPTIVFEDARIDQAIAGILYGVFSSTGQSCVAGSRLFVHRKIREEFVGKLVEAARQLPIGHPDDPVTRIAPLVAFDHRDRVHGFVERAIEAGGRLLCGGEIPRAGALGRGAYYPPTILSDLDATCEFVREEVFGPVLAVLSFEDEDDLIRQANDSIYGLACGIWTRDTVKAWRVARAVQAGTVWVNTYKQFSISTPFGGWKASGMGREKGLEGIRGYMNQKSIYLGLSEAPLPWAGLPQG